MPLADLELILFASLITLGPIAALTLAWVRRGKSRGRQAPTIDPASGVPLVLDGELERHLPGTFRAKKRVAEEAKLNRKRKVRTRKERSS